MKARTALYQLAVVGKDGASFAGTEILRGLETETARCAECRYFFAAPFGEMRLTGVLKDRDVVRFGDREDFIHVRYVATQMNGQDCTSARRNRRLDFAGIDLECLPIGINEHRQGMLQQHYVNGCDKSVRR